MNFTLPHHHTPALRPLLPACLLAALFLCLAGETRAQVADEANTFRLAQTYEQATKYEQALRYYQDLAAYRPANTGYFDGVRRCLTALKRYDDVIALLTSRLASYPRDVALLVQRGSAWYRTGNAAKAYEDWDAAIALQPKNSQTYMAVADEAVDTRQYDKAAEVLRQGREALKAPNLFVFELARALTMGMHYDQAMDEYVRYLIAEPSAQWQVQQSLSQFSEIPQALDIAIRSAQRGANANPDNLQVRSLLAWLYMERKDYSGAAAVTREIDKLKKSNGIELLMFAQRAFYDGQYQASLDTYRDLAEQYPKAHFVPEAEFYTARCTEALVDAAVVPDEMDPRASRGSSSRYEKVLSMYREVAGRYPAHPVGYESLYRIGYIRFMRFDDRDGALEILRPVAEKRRQFLGKFDADELIGDVLLAKGDAQGALAQYTNLLAQMSATGRERDQVSFKVAEIHYFLGDFAQALKELEPLGEISTADIANDALALSSFIGQYQDPNDAPLRRYAQAMFLERQRKLDDAIAVMSETVRAFDAMPILDQAWVELGTLQRDAGHGTDAIATWEAFLAKHPESLLRDAALFGLGSLYEASASGRGKAVEMYQRILSELPNSLYADRARARILILRKGNS